MFLSTEDDSSTSVTLRFDQTADRRLLHRKALSEVFLTDSVATGGHTYRAGAVLPSSHAYYTDHPGHSSIDPLLLLECARQAETFGAHTHFGVSVDTKFVLQSWSMRLPGLFAVRAGRPWELTVSAESNQPLGGKPHIRSASYTFEFSVGEHSLGEARATVAYLPQQMYDYLRSKQRGAPTTLSDSVPSVASNVEPWCVGRSSTVNSLLLSPYSELGAVRAGVRLPSDNASMFDHPLDHLPGMVLTEAARQVCLLAGERLFGRPAATTTVTGLDLAFTRFAELDSLVRVSTTPKATAQQFDEESTKVQTFDVVFQQHDVLVAQGAVETCPVPAHHCVVR